MSFSWKRTGAVFPSVLQRHHWRLWGLLLLSFLSAGPVARTWADEPARAGLVVVIDEGRVETRCVDIEGDSISGAELLARSGLSAIVDPSSGMGLIVCQIEAVGCAHPAEPCFCQCMGGGECIYWNYFFKEPEQSEWTYSALGAAMHQVKAGSVDAWVWGDGSVPPATELGFDSICVPPAPEPSETPTLEPTAPASPTIASTPTSAATTPATELPTATALPTDPAPNPSPASQTTAPPPAPTPAAAPSGDQDLVGYWPFGLILLGMAAAGGLVWYRRK